MKHIEGYNLIDVKTMKTNIIIFDDGKYFTGVKGHVVRKSVHFKDAKIMKELNERDRRYLKNLNYDLIEVVYCMGITLTI